MGCHIMKNGFFAIFAGCFLLATLGWTQASERSQITPLLGKVDTLTQMRIYAVDPGALASQLEDEGYDVLEGGITDISVDVIVSRESRQRLESEGYVLEFIAQGRPLREIMAEQAVGDSLPSGYLSYPEIVNRLQVAGSTYPAICDAINLSSQYGIQTYEGRDLWAVKISDNVGSEEQEPAFLLVSCHHAREIVTPELALYAMDQFTSQYGIDPDITAVVDNYEIWIAPVWNPDGYQYCYDVDNMWRKNRHVFAGGTGVDMNRNYPFGWDSSCSGSTYPSSETYKGPSAGSEAETQIMMAWSEEQHFAKVIDYHSSGREVLWAYAYCQTHPLDAFLLQEAIALSNASGYGGDYRVPSSQGEHFEWQLAEMGAHANLIETATTFIEPHSVALSEAAMVFPGSMWMINRPISLTGTVTEAGTGAPLVADIENLDVNYLHGEHNQSYLPFGMYHAFLPAGNYDIRFTVAGYDPQVHNVTILADQSTVLDVVFGSVAPPCPGDLDDNDQIDVLDAVLVVEAFGNSGGPEDIDGNGTVELADVEALCDLWGPCPEP